MVHIGHLVIVLCGALLAGVATKTQLREAYVWRLVDFDYPNAGDRQDAIDNEVFIPGHNVPVGLEVWNDKIFVTIPRWKNGVPASLAYFTTSDRTDSPVLKPYPNWAAHNLSPTNPHRIVSPFRIRADSCDRLWILDTGTNEVVGNTTYLSPTQVIVYDLKTDRLLRNFTLPEAQYTNTSLFASLAVDVVDCDNTYAYLADLGGPGLVVYDWANNYSWKIKNEAFLFDPRAIDFDISGQKFTWQDGVFGLALSEVTEPKRKFRDLYFHAFSSFDEYRVSTEFLRDEQLTRDGMNGREFKKIGSRTPSKTQAHASFIDESTGVLFYTQVNLYGIGCWNYRRSPSYTPDTQELIAVSEKKLIFPNDIKIDNHGKIWILSDNMITFLYNPLDPNEINFRILTATVKDLVSDSKCAPDDKPKDDTGISNRIDVNASPQTRFSFVLVPLGYLVYCYSHMVL